MSTRTYTTEIVLVQKNKTPNCCFFSLPLQLLLHCSFFGSWIPAQCICCWVHAAARITVLPSVTAFKCEVQYEWHQICQFDRGINRFKLRASYIFAAWSGYYSCWLQQQHFLGISVLLSVCIVHMHFCYQTFFLLMLSVWHAQLFVSCWLDN